MRIAKLKLYAMVSFNEHSKWMTELLRFLIQMHLLIAFCLKEKVVFSSFG